MQFKYWKAVIQYGHVGRRNEVSVARYMVFPANTTIQDVVEEVNHMPGTKCNCLVSVQSVSRKAYIDGKKQENENFYLKNLFQFGA